MTHTQRIASATPATFTSKGKIHFSIMGRNVLKTCLNVSMIVSAVPTTCATAKALKPHSRLHPCILFCTLLDTVLALATAARSRRWILFVPIVLSTFSGCSMYSCLLLLALCSPLCLLLWLGNAAESHIDTRPLLRGALGHAMHPIVLGCATHDQKITRSQAEAQLICVICIAA